MKRFSPAKTAGIKRKASLADVAAKFQLKRSKKALEFVDENVSDVSSEDEDDESKKKDKETSDVEVSSDEEEELEETADEKRLRLTKEYLATLGAMKKREGLSDSEDGEGGEEDEEAHTDEVGNLLRKQALEQAGKLRSIVATQLKGSILKPCRILKGHRVRIQYYAPIMINNLYFSHSFYYISCIYYL